MELNNIYCGNAYELIKEIPDKSVDLIVTDPPYKIEGLNSKPHGIFAKDGHTRKYEQEMLNSSLGEGINLSILDEFVRVMKKINIYLWCNKEQIYDYLTYFVKDRKCNWEMIIWSKTNPPPFTSGHYLKDKEYCLFFWENGIKVKSTYETGKTFYTSSLNVQDKQLYSHPTIKPLNIIKNFILNSSEVGGVVLDTFIGSGTTCVAAKELNRNYIGFEINETYYQIAVDRLNGITQVERRNKEKGELNIFDFDYGE